MGIQRRSKGPRRESQTVLERDNGENEGAVREKVEAEGQAQFPEREHSAVSKERGAWDRCWGGWEAGCMGR